MDTRPTSPTTTTTPTTEVHAAARAVAIWIRARLTSAGGDRAASLVEYALLVALIAVLCIGSLRFLGGTASSGLSSNASSLFGP
jgi:pilus assembly protein Flp/PilA